MPSILRNINRYDEDEEDKTSFTARLRASSGNAAPTAAQTQSAGLSFTERLKASQSTPASSSTPSKTTTTRRKIVNEVPTASTRALSPEHRLEDAFAHQRSTNGLAGAARAAAKEQERQRRASLSSVVPGWSALTDKGISDALTDRGFLPENPSDLKLNNPIDRFNSTMAVVARQAAEKQAWEDIADAIPGYVFMTPQGQAEALSGYVKGNLPQVTNPYESNPLRRDAGQDMVVNANLAGRTQNALAESERSKERLTTQPWVPETDDERYWNSTYMGVREKYEDEPEFRKFYDVSNPRDLTDDEKAQYSIHADAYGNDEDVAVWNYVFQKYGEREADKLYALHENVAGNAGNKQNEQDYYDRKRAEYLNGIAEMYGWDAPNQAAKAGVQLTDEEKAYIYTVTTGKAADFRQNSGDLYTYANRPDELTLDNHRTEYMLQAANGYNDEAILPSEKQTLNYLYRTGQMEKLDEYAAVLGEGRDRRRTMMTIEKYQKFADRDPVAASVASVLMSPMKGISYIGQVIDYIGDGKINENAGYNDFARVPDTIRGEISNNIAEATKDVFPGGVNWATVGYQTGMSMADFLYNALVSGAFSSGAVANESFKKVAEWMTLSIMGSGAGATETLEAKKRGLSDGQAIALGTIAGIAEVLTEKISLDKLLNPNLEAGALKYIMENALVEGAEEVGADLINTVADAIIAGDKNKIRQRMYELQLEGYSANRAYAMALTEQLRDTVLSFVGGFASGGIMAGSGAAINYNNFRNAQETKRIFDAIDPSRSNLDIAAMTMAYEDGLRTPEGRKALVENALNASDFGENISEQARETIGRNYNGGQQSAPEYVQDMETAYFAGIGGEDTIADLVKDNVISEDTPIEALQEVYRDGRKQAQVNRIQSSEEGRAMGRTGIQSSDEIMTFREAVDWAEQNDAVTEEMRTALDTGQIEVYSVGDLKNGTAVFLDKAQAQDYAETRGGEVVSTAVPTSDVAWSDYNYGQYTGDNYVGENSVRGIEGRTDSESAGISVRSLESRTGRFAGAAERSGIYETRQELQKSAKRKISAASLIENGSTNSSVTEIEYKAKGMPDDVNRAASLLMRAGFREENIHFYVGDLRGKDNVRVQGFTDGEHVWVQADNNRYTAEQIAGHEAMHRLIQNGSVSIENVRSWMRTNAPEAAALIETIYQRSYKGLNGLDLWEEAICDAAGGINIQAARYNFMQGLLRSAMPSLQTAIEQTSGKTVEEIQGGELEAERAEKLSRAIDYGQTDEERYRLLKEETIRVTIARSVSDSEQREILNAIPLTIKGNDAVRLVRELNKKSDGGLLRSYRSPQVDLDFNFTMHGVRESIFTQLERTGDLSNFAVVLANLNDVIENAALIERHRDKYKGTARENHSLIGTHVLVSTIGVKDAIVPVQLEVKEYSGQSNRLYITLTLGEIEKATIFEGRPGDVSSTLPTIKLSELFKNVNSNETDFLKYIPDQFLNEDQLEGKQRGLEEEREKIAKYTIDDGIVKRSVEADPEILKTLNTDYMHAVESGDMETAQRMVDEAARRNGYTEKVYHGTPTGGFTKFDSSIKNFGKAFGDGIYFTDSNEVAQNFTSRNRNLEGKFNPTVYDGYLNLGENPLVIDMDQLRKENGNKPSLIKYLVDEEVKAKGPDASAIVIKGIYDGSDQKSTVYVAKESNQFKSADPVTYDDNGNVIPLSERFDSKNNDIRYSAEAVESAARRAGYTIHAYHGSPATNITSFDAGRAGQHTGVTTDQAIWFTDNEKFADNMSYEQRAGNSSLTYKRGAKGKVYDSYLKMDHPFDIRNMTDEMQDDLWDMYQEVQKGFGLPAGTRKAFDKLIDGSSDQFIKFYLDYDMLKERGYDGVIARISEKDGTEYGVFSPEQVKSADQFTYDDNGNVIPLSERFNRKNNDIRYSAEAAENIRGEGADLIDGEAVVKTSLESWGATDKTKLLSSLMKAGFAKDVAQAWIDDVNTVSSIIAADRERLDYDAADNQVMLKNNSEYVKTLDASTLCAKRLLYQGTFNRITELLPNSVLTPDDLIRVRQIMAERNDEVPCGICYVESRRKTLSKFAGQWLNEVYKGDVKVNMNDLTSTDGLERLRKTHPDVYDQYTKWMRGRGTANPKVVELRTAYRNDISKLTAGQIEKITRIGGLRVQSFSDFETVHLIDMMQAVLDMSAKKLTAQAYTKVPNFAWAFGDTGIKINLSLIGKAVNGELVFDSKEGMNINDAMKLRDRYSENVGTILVGANDESIRLAMADDRIDFIIPFHRSGWSGAQFEALGLTGYDDYQDYQNERHLDGTSIKEGNLYPIDYWDYSLTGKENAERYLEICKEQKRIPKFEQFLKDNGDGSWSLPEDGSSDGYWKMLIDFKMYNNQGIGAPQRAVTANVNMEEARRILNEYDGRGNRSLPVDEEAAKQFADEYKAEHKDAVMYSVEAEDQSDDGYRELTDTINELRTELRKQTARAEHFKAETRLSQNRGQVDEASAERFTRSILKEYESKADFNTTKAGVTEYANWMRKTFNELRTVDDELRWADFEDEAYTRAVDLMRPVVLNTETLMNEDLVEIGKDIRSYLKSGRGISISEADQRSIYTLGYDNFNDFRRRNFGNLKITKDGPRVDQVWSELQDQFGKDFFPDDIMNTLDQLGRISEVLSELEPVYGNPFASNAFNAEEAVDYAARDVVSRVLTGEVREVAPTFSDKMHDRLAAAQKEAVRRVQEVRQEARTKNQEKINALKSHYAEMNKNRVTLSQMAKERQRLLKIAKRLMNRKLPAVNKAWVEEMVGDLDLIATSITGRKLQNLMDLENWYEEQKQNPDFIPMPQIEKQLQRLVKRQMGSARDALKAEKNGLHFDGMTQQEVLDLTEALLNFEHQLDTRDKLINSEDKRSVYAMTLEVLTDIENSRGINVGRDSKLYMAVRNFVIDETLNPRSVFRRIAGYKDSDPLYQRYVELNEGQHASMTYEMNALDEFKEWMNDKEFQRDHAGRHAKTVTGTFGGQQVTMTRDVLISLYMHSLNDDNMRHIARSGIEIPDAKQIRNGNLKRAYEKTTKVRIQPSEMKAFLRGEGKLTDKEMSFVRAMQKYFAETSQKELNRVSLALYGYERANEENYFPIEVDKNFLRQDAVALFKERESTGEITMDPGFLQSRVESSQMIVGRGALDVLRSAIHKNAIFIGYAIPIRNFTKVYSSKSVDFKELPSFRGQSFAAIDKASVRDLIQTKWGERANKYIVKLITDAQGIRAKEDPFVNMLRTVRSNYAGAVLTVNLSVALKQAASYPTAAAVIGWKPLLKAFGLNFYSKVDRVNPDLIKKYTPLLDYRRKGFTDTERGELAQRKIHVPAALNWIQGMDVLTTQKLWRACEYYVQDNFKSMERRSDPYYRKVAEIYNRVIEETQPNYTTMQRPGNLRGGFITTSINMFKTQPYQNFNILYDAFGNFAAKRRALKIATDENVAQAKAEYKQARATLWHSTSAIAVSTVVFAAATFAWGLLRKKKKPEDAEKEIAKSMISSLVGMVPLLNIPLDLLSAHVFGGKYWGYETVTAGSINDFTEGVDKIITAWDDGKQVKVKDVANLAFSISQLFGLPLSNVVNLLNIGFAWAGLGSLQDFIQDGIAPNDANYVWEQRRKAGVSTKQIAEACGVQESTVQGWMSGKIPNMNSERKSTLARLLGVSVSELEREIERSKE